MLGLGVWICAVCCLLKCIGVREGEGIGDGNYLILTTTTSIAKCGNYALGGDGKMKVCVGCVKEAINWLSRRGGGLSFQQKICVIIAYISYSYEMIFCTLK